MQQQTILEHLNAGRLEEAAQAIREHSQTKSSGLNVALCRDSLLDPTRTRGDPYVAKLSEVEIDTGYWTVFDRERAYPTESYHRNFANSPLVRQRVSPGGDRFLVTWAAPSVTIEQPCVLVGSDDNYSHWVLRSLLKLWLIDREPALRELPWVVAAQLTQYQREYLDLLGVAEARLLQVPANDVVHCRSLQVPTQMLGNRGFVEGVKWIRGKLAPSIAAAGEAHDRIYVARADQPRRRLLNEREIFEALAPLGFRWVVLTGMPVRDQVAIFSRAHCIVGPHGAGLTNIIYSPPGASIVEIGSTNILQQNHFRWMAPLLQQRVEPVVSSDYVMEESRRSEVQPVNWDYRAPVHQVRDAVLKLLA